MEGPLPLVIVNYFQRPTLENAQFLLASYGLSIPRPSAALSDDKPSERPMKRARYGGGARATEARIHALSRLDVLHDLNGEPLSLATFKVILDDAELTHEERTSIEKAYANPRANVTKLISKIMGLQEKTRNASHEEVAERWKDAVRLEIVMDGVVEQLHEPLSKRDYQTYERSMCLHAFVMALFAASPQKLQKLVFLYGVFQYMDISGWKAFLKRWMTQLDTHVKASVQIKYITPASIQPYSGRFAVDEKAIYVDGVMVPIKKPITQHDSLDVMKKIQSSFGVTTLHYPKSYLQTLFARFDATEDKETHLQFMKRVMDVNFFRDAYKADVALRRAALYLTFDRLAFVYYKMRCELEGCKKNGLLYCISGKAILE